MVDACGTRRRLQALAAIGWTYTEVGEKVGTKGNNLSAICTKKKQVYPQTAERVKQVYNELSMQKPPEDRAHKWARNIAEGKIYVPPLGWDDDEIDDPEAWPSGLTQSRLEKWVRRYGTEKQKEEYFTVHRKNHKKTAA